ncbi:MAG: hypothetical protein ACLPKB_11935 [Xanthobacteraceae bacterium]
MSRLLPTAALTTLTAILALLIAAYAVRVGVVADDTVRLWAGASAAGGGEVPIGRIVSAYPSVPFLATTLISFLTPNGSPAPALLAAALLGLMTRLWFVRLRGVGLPGLYAGLATLLLALHPALLRAVADGPADMFLALFLFLMARALYDLRARTQTSEVMAVGVTLLGVAFSHPMGAAFAVAAIPFLILAVPPVLARSAFSVVAPLIFPTIFAALAFVYVAWVFPGSGWSIFGAPAESLVAWSAVVARRFGEGLTGSLALDTALGVLLALVLGAPVAAFATVWVRQRRPLVMPPLVFAAAAVAAAILAVATGLFGDPTAVTVAAPALAAAAVMRVPLAHARESLPRVMALLVLGWLGGVVGLALINPATVTRFRTLLDGGTDPERSDALALGGATSGRNGVLVDSDNAPAVVLGREAPHGLFGPSNEAFALTLLFGRIGAPFVAVPDPRSMSGQNDKLNRAFPGLYRQGPSGYQLIYHNNTWKLFERSEPKQLYGH